ncbi:hypothetical protein RintRC_1214 [Richelia intracellularis]|nr:hypothetical protein RintRC_1214 [Richelia intracellularis]
MGIICNCDINPDAPITITSTEYLLPEYIDSDNINNVVEFSHPQSM